ncbi:hypothetical protein [Mycolicibacter minnesotensis]|uniref:hypothetical protein n=1 Tax=Mycolicibacter minnesotensis TaxID=1118379 RepID=UPI00138CEBAD|nr:hypothetical protein MMIN_22250 [Mycolicibacter minnesotensis]
MRTTAIVRALVELAAAVAAAVGCAVSWSQVRYLVLVAPVTSGEPETSSVSYHPQMLLLAGVWATGAGVLAVVGIARLRRAARGTGVEYPTGVSSSR